MSDRPLDPNTKGSACCWAPVAVAARFACCRSLRCCADLLECLETHTIEHCVTVTKVGVKRMLRVE